VAGGLFFPEISIEIQHAKAQGEAQETSPRSNAGEISVNESQLESPGEKK
jgi:hypothetical protein